MNDINTPKAYLITASYSFEDSLEASDQKHIHKINKLTYLVDAKTGFYLISALAGGASPDYCVASIFTHVHGHFTPETQRWLEYRGVEIHHTRA